MVDQQPGQNLVALVPDASDAESEPLVRKVQVERVPVGSSGTRIFSGFIDEEYLNGLKGMQRADVFDKMRRSESQIKMVLSAVKNLIRAAHWDVEPADETPEAEKQAEFLDHVFFEDMDRPWRRFISEALTMIDFGHSVFEVVHKVVPSHPDFGSYIGIKKLAFRSQRTIQRFNVDKETGDLASVTQLSFGDLQRLVDIPSEFLVIFTLDQEGDNYEGISLLRACYGPYMRKQVYLKLEGIGSEKYAVPTPVLTIPKGKENSSELDTAKQALEVYTSHESNYLMLPEGWTVDFPQSEFDPAKLKTSIDGCDQAMVKAVLANFLELGMSSGGGSYSLSLDQSDFFVKGIVYIADEICEVVNRCLIPSLIDMKFGPQKSYPKLKHSGIDDEAGKELAESLKMLSESNVVEPDDVLEENVRKRYRLPKKSDLGRRTGKAAPVTLPAPSGEAGQPQPDQAGGATPPAAAANAGKPGEKPTDGQTPPAQKKLAERVLLAEKNARKQIGDGKALIKDVMQSNLRSIADDLITQIMAKVRKLPASQRQAAVKALELKGKGAYRSELLDLLSTVAQGALDSARNEVPKKKGVKLGEDDGAIRLGPYDKLPKKIKDKVQSQADNLVDSQIADLEKMVYFQFDHSVDSTDSDAILEKDLSDSADDYIGGASVEAASGNTTALIVNTARNAFFFEPEVLDEIQSFTFVNGDPVSPICQDLAGRTFEKDDPEAQRYFPPLHHNCKSYIVPNLSASKEIDPEGLTPSSPSIAASITLAELVQMPGVSCEIETPDEFTKIHTYSKDGAPVWRVTETFSDAQHENLTGFQNERL